MVNLMRFVNSRAKTYKPTPWHVQSVLGGTLCGKRKNKSQTTEIREVARLVPVFHCEACVAKFLGKPVKRPKKPKPVQLSLF